MTFAVTSGELTMTAPATADLGSGAPGTTITGEIGATTVTDDRALAQRRLDRDASATDFTTGGGTPAETIPATDANYSPGTITTTGTITATPHEVTLDGEPQHGRRRYRRRGEQHRLLEPDGRRGRPRPGRRRHLHRDAHPVRVLAPRPSPPRPGPADPIGSRRAGALAGIYWRAQDSQQGGERAPPARHDHAVAGRRDPEPGGRGRGSPARRPGPAAVRRPARRRPGRRGP